MRITNLLRLLPLKDFRNLTGDCEGLELGVMSKQGNDAN